MSDRYEKKRERGEKERRLFVSILTSFEPHHSRKSQLEYWNFKFVLVNSWQGVENLIITASNTDIVDHISHTAYNTMIYIMFMCLKGISIIISTYLCFCLHIRSTNLLYYILCHVSVWFFLRRVQPLNYHNNLLVDARANDYT